MDKYAGYDFGSLKKAGESKKGSTFGGFKLGENSGFEPEIPGSDPVQRDLQESGLGSDSLSEGIQAGDWVLASREGDHKEFAIVMRCQSEGGFGSECSIYFPRGGSSVMSVSESSLEKVSDDQVPSEYHDMGLDSWIAGLRGKAPEVQPFDAEEAELSARPDAIPGGEFSDDGGPDSPYVPPKGGFGV